MAGKMHEEMIRIAKERGIDAEKLENIAKHKAEGTTPSTTRGELSCMAVLAAICILVAVVYFGLPNGKSADATGKGQANASGSSDVPLLTEIDDNEALIMCQYHAEARAKFDYEWEGLFGIPDKKGIDRKVTAGGDVTVTVYGGGLKLQNGFGAWSRHTFICEVSTKTKSVTEFQIF